MGENVQKIFNNQQIQKKKRTTNARDDDLTTKKSLKKEGFLSMSVVGIEPTTNGLKGLHWGKILSRIC